VAELLINVAKRPIAGGPPKSLDMVTYIDGMFRILDLVSEQGSGGLGIISFFLCQKASLSNLRPKCSGQYHNRSRRTKSIHQ
jgi:hypothetical protein